MLVWIADTCLPITGKDEGTRTLAFTLPVINPAILPGCGCYGIMPWVAGWVSNLSTPMMPNSETGSDKCMKHGLQTVRRTR